MTFITKRVWFTALCIYYIYLLTGGFVFQALEWQNDCDEKKKEFDQEIDAERRALDLSGSFPPEYTQAYKSLLESVHNLRRTFLEDQTDPEIKPTFDEDEQCTKWNYYSSLYFSFTVATTIGYGVLSPQTDGGKIFYIFYAIFGITINGIIVGALGDFMNNKLKHYRTYIGFARKHEDPNLHKTQAILDLLIDVTVYLIPGSIFLLFIPGAIFSLIEDWPYLDGFYFAFTSLSTIGFGDFMAGSHSVIEERLGIFKYVFLVVLIFYTIVGMSFIVVIIERVVETLEQPSSRAITEFVQAEHDMIEQIMEELKAIKEDQARHPSHKLEIEPHHLLHGQEYHHTTLPMIETIREIVEIDEIQHKEQEKRHPSIEHGEFDLAHATLIEFLEAAERVNSTEYKEPQKRQS